MVGSLTLPWGFHPAVGLLQRVWLRAAHLSPCRTSCSPQSRGGERSSFCDPREAACEENVYWCPFLKEGVWLNLVRQNNIVLTVLQSLENACIYWAPKCSACVWGVLPSWRPYNCLLRSVSCGFHFISMEAKVQVDFTNFLGTPGFTPHRAGIWTQV